ncbi:MAG: S8 family serine peptidase [Anaerosomatales bacterium]|nr:S8 family serine peptidase [Anaerosomatales bacterium]
MSLPRTRFIAAVLAALVAATWSAPVRAAVPDGRGADGVEAIVSFDAARASEALAAVEASGGRVKRMLRSGTEALVVFPKGQSVESVRVRVKRSSSAVRAIAPNGRLRPASIPNDPFFSKQWALPAADVLGVWDITRGSPTVRVAVIDSGVYLSHPDLRANLDLANDWDFANGDATAEEEYPHGTHVAGIVAAVADNAVGVAGAAPGVKVLPLKVIDRNGIATTADFVDAVRYATDKGACIINASLGEALDPAVPSDAAEIALLQEAVDYARAKGVLVVAASGNGSGPPVWYPAACDGAIAVSATTRAGDLAPYSSTGPQVDLAAPGGYATSWETRENGVLSTWNGGDYAYAIGTSMAAPHVAGIAALLMSACPSATADTVRTALEASARDIAAPGLDSQTGHGLVQANAALARLSRVSRVAGADRYATAAAASRAAFATGTCEAVVIASGEDFPDALAAAPLAGALRAPVLLVRRTSVPASTAAEIARLGASRAVIVGGPGAVSTATADALASLGLAVQRVGGRDRYETAALVAARVAASSTGTRTVLVTRGDLFPDATAAGAPAASSGSPVVLVKPTELPDAARTAIAGAAPCQVIVVGGTAAVSADVAAALASIPGVEAVERWSGLDRYATAAAVAAEAVARGMCDDDLVAVASGLDFPDALAGGAAAGALRGALLLSRPDVLPDVTRSHIVRRLAPGGAAWTLGGPGALSYAVQAAVIRAMP